MKWLVESSKIVGFAICLFYSVGVQAQLDAGRLVYYPFDGTGDDLSGNGFNSIDFTNSFGPDQFGNPDGAFQGNGIDTYFDLPAEPDLKPQFPITVAFYINFNSTAASQSVIFTLDYAQNNHSGLWMNLSSSGGMVINFGGAIGNANASNRNSKVGTTVIQTGVWYCVVAIARGFNDMDIYIDGVNDGGNYSGAMTNMVYTDEPGSIARKDNDPPPYYLNGRIEDFMLWDRELTPDEIASYCSIDAPLTVIVDEACPGEATTLLVSGFADPASVQSVDWEVEGVGNFEGISIEFDDLLPGVYTYQVAIVNAAGQTQILDGIFEIPEQPGFVDIETPSELSLCGVDEVSVDFTSSLQVWSQVLDADGMNVLGATFDEPGTYTFTFLHPCATVDFEIEVTGDLVLPDLALPEDVCIGDPLGVDIEIPGIDGPIDATMDWGDGTVETSSLIQFAHSYQAPGSYAAVLSGTADGCNFETETLVTAQVFPDFVVLQPGSFCEGDVFELEFQPSGFDVIGPGGDFIQSFETSQSGAYTFTATNACGDVAQTIELVFLIIDPTPLPLLPAICPGRDTVRVGFSDASYTYTWQDGSTNPFYTTFSAGVYQVEVTLGDCAETFGFSISEQTPLDLSPFPDDAVTVCSEGPRALVLPNLGVLFTFPDGSEGLVYTVEASTSLELAFSDGCYNYSKAVEIELIDCLCPLFVPNAFTPDEDGLNDIFKAVANCPVEGFHMRIFNRWGDMVFESRSIDKGWNGQSPNNDFYAQDQLYYYFITYGQRLDGLLEPAEISGHVTLLR